jgi:hypothetical protein
MTPNSTQYMVPDLFKTASQVFCVIVYRGTKRRFLPIRLQSQRMAPSEPLVARIDFDADRLKGEHSEDRFGVVRADDHNRRDEFAHKFKMGATDWQSYRRSIGSFVNSLARALNPDFTEAIAGDDAVERPGINRKQPFPAPFEVRWIANGDG